MQTSVSDIDDYKAVCLKACIDEFVFKFFRRHPSYDYIVECGSFEDARDYGGNIVTSYPDILPMIEEYRKNDNFGGPMTGNYAQFGQICPNTLRHIHMAAEIRRIFGSLAEKRVAEIGGGYGGLCRIIKAMMGYRSYSIFDLRETLLLVKKWLEKLDTKADFWYLDDYNSTEYFDMVISVFAFSEINKDVQDLYLDKVIKRSHHGFMVFNDQWVGLPVYSAHEIAARIPGARSVPYQAFGLEKRFQAHAVIW